MGGTSNPNLIQQAQSANGMNGGATSTQLAPATDISQIPGGAQIYANGGVSGTAPNTPSVLTGGKNAFGLSHKNTGGSTTSTNKPQTLSVEQWQNYFYTSIANNQSVLQKFSTEMALAGMVKTGATTEQLYAAWQKLIVQSYNHTINGQQQSPFDILANSIPGSKQGSFKQNGGQAFLTGMSQQDINDLATKASQSSKDSTTTTQKTSVDINYTDPDTARYVLNQASQQLLGRRATNDEISTFTKNLNNNEKIFPKMTQSTEQSSGTTDTGTSSGITGSTSGPVSPTGAGNASGQTVVGYDSAGNPIYGPGTTTGTPVQSSITGTSKNVTDTNISLGEADYTRYGREQLAEDQAMSAPDYGAYQAAGPLFQAFLSALKAPVSNIGSNG